MKKRIRIIILMLCFTIGLTSLVLIFNTQKQKGNIDKEIYAQENQLPKYYCLRDEYVLPTQYQSSSALCWDFASSTVLTTAILKKTNQYMDFSEAWISLVRSHEQIGFTPGNVGNFMEFDTTARNCGLVLEQDYNFETNFWITKENTDDLYNYFSNFADKDLINNYKSVYFSNYQNYEEEQKISYINTMKQHIMDNSAIYTLCHWTTNTLNYNGKIISYKQPQATGTSHAITIIGWDDNISAYLNNKEYKGAWIILNSYGNANGDTGIWYAFYDDTDIYQICGYQYYESTGSLYLKTKIIDSNEQYETNLKGAYYGNFQASTNITKQKNIFFNNHNINLTYSYDISNNTNIDAIEIYQFENCITNSFNISINKTNKTINISKNNCDLGAYKIIISYSNSNESEFINIPFYICNETEISYIEISSSSQTYNDGRYQYFSNLNTNYHDIVISTTQSTGTVSLNFYFATYSKIREITCPSIIDYYKTATGINLTFSYDLFYSNEYYVNVSNSNNHRNISITILLNDSSNDLALINYDLDGGINNELNLKRNLVSDTEFVKLYNPTKEGFGFVGWYTSSNYEDDKILKNINGEFYLTKSDVKYYSAHTCYTQSYLNTYIKKTNFAFIYAKWIKLNNNETYHKITTSVYGDGEINEKGIIYVEHGSNKLITINQKNCHLAKVFINGEKVSDNLIDSIVEIGYELKNIQNDIHIEAHFVPSTYIKYYVKHWKESFLSSETVEINGICYALEEVEILYVYNNTQSQASLKQYDGYDAQIFDQIIVNENNNVINIYYNKCLYNIRVDFIGYKDGTINKMYSLKYNDSLTINFEQIGYIVTKYIVDDTEYSGYSYTISNIQSNHKIEVQLERIKFALNINCSAGGMITTLDNLEYDEDALFEIYVEDGYYLYSLIVNDKEVIIENSTFKINNIKENIFINAIFLKKIEYYVNHWKETDLSTNTFEINGRYYKLEETQVLYAENNTQSQAKSIEYQGYIVQAYNQIIIDDNNKEINIYYNKCIYNVEVNYIGYKDNSLNTNYLIKYDDLITINFSQTGYTILEYFVDGTRYIGNSCTIENVHDNHIIVVQLKKIKFALDINCNTGGTITTNNNLEYGQDVIFEIHVDDGYIIYLITLNGKEISIEDNKFKVNNISEDINIEAKFLTINEYNELTGKYNSNHLFVLIVIISITVTTIALSICGIVIMNKNKNKNKL